MITKQMEVKGLLFQVVDKSIIQENFTRKSNLRVASWTIYHHVGHSWDPWGRTSENRS
jgi:hypothetical protein